jgi:hypothetical protein
MRIVILCFFYFLSLNAQAAGPLGGVPLITPITSQNQVFGKTLSVIQQAETVPSGQGIVSTTGASMSGVSKTLVEASVEAIPPAPSSTTTTTSATTGPTPSGVILATTDLYIGGTKIWTGTLTEKNGSLVYTGGVAPTQIPFTLFVYPVGPLLLEVDAGVDFEGNISASLIPGFSYPLQDSELDAKLAASVSAGAFLDGYASLWLIRAGVGGTVNIIDGSIGVSGRLLMNGQAPTGSGTGSVQMLNGEFYGFVDTDLLFGNWSRIYTKDFYSWAGYCFSFEGKGCGGVQ